jgi:glycosyltransferase involved in cell wall biosynthesis
MARDIARSPLVFVFPAGSEGVSGGNIYNSELTKALAELVPVSVASFAEAAGDLASKRPGIYLFDTLELDLVGTLPPRVAGQEVGLVVHLLPSLEPGAAEDDAAIASEKAKLRRFDFFVATSDFTRTLLVSRGFAEDAILTVPPGLPVVENDNDVTRAYEPPLRAVVVGNLIPRKGVLPLLEALAAKPAPDRYSLRIVGRGDMDPAYAEACRRAAAASPSLRDAVRIEGPVPYQRTGEVYEASHLAVSPALFETYGMAIREARAHGLPVLAFDGGYARHHFTHGDDGFSYSSHAELARTLVELAGDERRMASLFERARATRPAPFSWRQAAERFLAELGRPR